MIGGNGNKDAKVMMTKLIIINFVYILIIYGFCATVQQRNGV